MNAARVIYETWCREYLERRYYRVFSVKFVLNLFFKLTRRCETIWRSLCSVVLQETLVEDTLIKAAMIKLVLLTLRYFDHKQFKNA